MNLTGKKTLWGLGLAALLGVVGVGVLVLWPHTGGASNLDGTDTDDEPGQAESVPEVPVIHPRNDLAASIVVQEPADVVAFYRADLEALVAGTVKYMPRGLNDSVRKDERLLVIDVPDRVQEVLEKEAVIEQRKQELSMAAARARIAAAGVKAAQEYVKQKQAEVVVADAEQAYRRDELRRYRGLVRDKVITRDLLAEKYKYYLVAESGTVSARVAVQKANADLKEKKAQEEAANVDIELKKSLIKVAARDRDRAQALADYATITAPFDGLIIRRNVDPGDFVQNAATGQSRPLLSVVRTDIVTVVMKVPDTYAQYVSNNTEAMIDLPDRQIKGAKVTRFSPSIQSRDRTMRVEVDLYNGARADYNRFLARGISSFFPSVGLARPLENAVLLTAAQSAWSKNMKGSMDPLPALAEQLMRSLPGRPRALLPGMYGYMTLKLRDFRGAYLVPSKAVFALGGKNYVLRVKNGKAQRVPVEVQLRDRQLAKVVLLTYQATDTGEYREPQELTGKDVLITANQTEIRDGQAVKVREKTWTVKAAQRVR